jgi:Bacterial protein of unknown function (DUF916)
MKQQPSTFFVGANRKVLCEILCGVVLCVASFSVMGMSAPMHVAASGPSLGIQPAFFDPKQPLTRSYFIFHNTPGAHFKSAVRVSNTGTTAGYASLYGTDATTGATSGAVYLGRNSKPLDVGAWISLSVSSFTLAPGQSRSVPFEVTIPKTVRSGDHLGGIAMEVTPVTAAAAPTQQSGQMQIKTRIVTVVAVEMILPGAPIEALSATGIQGGGMNNYQTLALNLHNTGTMMVKPHGTLQLFDAHNAHLQTVPITMDTFLPATSINYPVYLKQALGVGKYQGQLTLTYGDNHVLQYNTFFSVTTQQLQQAFPTTSGKLQAPTTAAAASSSVPWWMFLVGGFFVLCGLLFLFQQSRRFALGRNKRKGVEE